MPRKESFTPQFGRNPFVADARDFPLRPLLKALPPAPPVTRLWTNSEPVMNQRQTPHCVGMGCAQWGNTLPVNDHYTTADGHKIYYESLVAGKVPKAEYGSQVRWGLKAMTTRGRVASYHLASGYDEALAWVRNPKGGPVIIGVNWFEGFNHPNFITKTISPSGGIVGGHCLLWYGASGSYSFWLNSWGSGWGKNGTCRISHRNARRAIEEGGEAWVAVERPK
jgi:hypothetical protein